jgi:hypothetical protein
MKRRAEGLIRPESLERLANGEFSRGLVRGISLTDLHLDQEREEILQAWSEVDGCSKQGRHGR